MAARGSASSTHAPRTTDDDDVRLQNIAADDEDVEMHDVRAATDDGHASSESDLARGRPAWGWRHIGEHSYRPGGVRVRLVAPDEHSLRRAWRWRHVVEVLWRVDRLWRIWTQLGLFLLDISNRGGDATRGAALVRLLLGGPTGGAGGVRAFTGGAV